MSKIAFLGAGLHTALGETVDACVDRLQHPPERASNVRYELDGRPVDLPYFLLAGCERDARRERQYEVLYRVVRQAIEEANLTPDQIRNMGLCLGTSSFEIALDEQRYCDELTGGSEAIPLRISGLGDLAARIREQFGMGGDDFSFNTACTSSANAAWYATKLVEQGELDHVLVVAVEFLNDTTVYGFHALQLLSHTGMCPFDERRDGLVLGEACAALVIGASKASDAMGILGGANLCDTHSMSTTQEDGMAASAVMRTALANAGVQADAINVVKCHGTATVSGDFAEARGMGQTFSRLPRTLVLKPFTGHTLGACGLVELILFYRALRKGFLPTTPHLDAGALGFALDAPDTPTSAGTFMLNFFGFGGNNTSLIISNYCQ